MLRKNAMHVHPISKINMTMAMPAVAEPFMWATCCLIELLIFSRILETVLAREVAAPDAVLPWPCDVAMSETSACFPW
jgi:hypothetical protein